jgi:putative transcriptional regulator
MKTSAYEASFADHLANHFLIAMPSMADGNFEGSLVFIAEHSTRGALGVVVNKLTDLNLARLFSRIELSLPRSVDASAMVLAGGPVQTDRGFVLHSPCGDWGTTIAVSDEIALTSSKDVLEAVTRGDGPEHMLISLGYSGWGPGQLEEEISRNAWLTVPADISIMFDVPAEDRLSRAFSLLGVNPVFLASAAGHA